MKSILSSVHVLAILGFFLHVGCDGVVGSAKRVDACGVCGGDNSTCRLVSGLFTRPQLPVGYNLIARIPPGACNITITELKQSRNYLALRGPDGNYVINGNWAINWSGEYEAVGTRFTYRRQDANNGELIEAPGPLLEPVDLMVIYQQPNPGIKYEYMLPMKAGDMAPSMMSVHRTAPDGNGIIAPPLLLPPGMINPEDELNKNGPTYDGIDLRRSDNPLYPYGTGVQGTESQSRSLHHSNHHNITPVGDEAHKPQPRTRGRKRKFMWKVTGYSECTKTCGGGTQLALVRCVKEHNQQIVLDKRCPIQEKPLSQSVRCNIKPCPAEWVGGEWSSCSVTCGEGLQKRDLMCKQEISPTLTMKVVEGACLSPPLLPRTQKCILPPCPSNQQPQQQEEPWKSKWHTGQWGKCSVACGQGIRSRSVKCVGPGNVDADDCSQEDKPAEEETCDMGHCSTGGHMSWFSTEWTQHCSEDCGTGVQTRKVHCPGAALDSCDAGSKPDETRACSSDKQCSGKWFTGPWGQCSSSCGHGRQTRDVICATFLRGQYRVALDMNCPITLKPETERPCEAKPCGPEWYFTDWTHCSRDCGSGVQKREVSCLDEKQQVSAGCSEEKRPPSRRVCNTHECSNSHSGHSQTKSSDNDPEFGHGIGDQAQPGDQDEGTHKGGDCVDKFRNCALVVQARLCKYKYYRNSCCHSCHKKS